MSDETTSNKLPLVICLMGPTASGKTELAMALADKLPCELISVDSALVYKGLDIGSAKPDAKTLAQYPHHLVDIRDPLQAYSAADFREDALALMADITARGKIPLLVGGTMLYFKVLLEGMSELPAADSKVRAEIEQLANTHGWPYVHQELAKVDPQTAQRLNPNDPQRVQRALEVYRLSGKPLSQWHSEQTRAQLPYNIVQFAMAPSQRSTLHQRIEKRFKLMLQLGFLNEVEGLMQRDELHLDLPAIRAVGYRQAWLHLQGEMDYDTMVDKGIIATRQLAKRQFTWLRSWPELNWIYTDADGENLPTSVLVERVMERLPATQIES